MCYYIKCAVYKRTNTEQCKAKNPIPFVNSGWQNFISFFFPNVHYWKTVFATKNKQSNPHILCHICYCQNCSPDYIDMSMGILYCHTRDHFHTNWSDYIRLVLKQFQMFSFHNERNFSTNHLPILFLLPGLFSPNDTFPEQSCNDMKRMSIENKNQSV